MKVSANFSVAEFRQPARHGHREVAYPEEWIETRLVSLCWALETLRSEFGGRKLRILSGYRSAAYNRTIGGARSSQHVLGRAADFVIDGVKPQDVHDRALRLYQDGFLRIGGLGNYPGFTHIDVRPSHRLARWKGARNV